MPYMLVSKSLRLDCGPTIVGDSDSDPDLMFILKADALKDPFTKIVSYTTKLAPRRVLNLLEEKGWSVVSSAGFGETCVWTLHRNY
ncbi:GTP cyclohydrolase 1 feedback regulatory protein-like isoform X2 [Penaeus indicus]|uniref:GTP cyclohydrolase 1 feedback regulatory protein-like isoform X2 n=1 Tax=Penaeus indicus TaxID=29960 RepID=UPI00300C3F1B